MRVGNDPAVAGESREQTETAGENAAREATETADPNTLKTILDHADVKVAERILANPNSSIKHDILNGYALLLEKHFSDVQRTENTWWLRPVSGRVVEATDKPERLLDEFSEGIPLAMFILLPAYALFLKILFYGGPRTIFYSEHMVFAIHLHVLAFLIFAANLLLPDAYLLGEIVFLALFIYLGVYSYRAMRNYYHRSRFATFWRFGLLGILYSSLFLPALGLVMVYAFIAL